MKKLVVFMLMVFIISSCITIKPNLPGDGSSFLKKEDSLIMDPFDLQSSLLQHQYMKDEDIKFQIINAGNLNLLLKQKPYNWLLIGSSWCPIADQEFHKSTSVIKYFNPDSIQFVFISQDFNLKELKKMILESSFTSVPYLLDLKKYGNDEKYKQEKFFQDLEWQLDPRFYQGGGVPKMFLIKGDSEMVFIGGYRDSNPDTITKYTGLKYLRKTKDQ